MYLHVQVSRLSLAHCKLQKATIPGSAADQTCIVQGYFLAALLFLGIVFSLPMSLGMYALALDLPVNVNEALAGLIMPASAYVLLGKSGAPTPPCACCSCDQDGASLVMLLSVANVKSW